MRVVFVDTENVGFPFLEKLEVSIVDKVYVFSKDAAVRRECQRRSLGIFSDYPAGPDQADFYIIACLSRLLATMTKEELKSVSLELCTNDKALIASFTFQCKLFGANCDVVSTIIDHSECADKICEMLHKPRRLDVNLRAELGVTSSMFAKVIGELVRTGRIQRASLGKKYWEILKAA